MVPFSMTLAPATGPILSTTVPLTCLVCAISEKLNKSIAKQVNNLLFMLLNLVLIIV